MNDFVLIYTITLAFIAVIVALLLVYRYFLGNRLVEQTKKLRAEINRIPKDVLELSQDTSGKIGNAIGEIGIEGIMSELGIDPGLLKNPLVKGLIDKYAPRLIEKMAKGGNEQEGSGNNLL